MMIKNWLTPLLLILLTSGLLWFFSQTNSTPAPNVHFTTIKNKSIELAALKGKPVLVTFWATDCPGCIAEIPHLIDLYQQYHPQGLEIIAVAMYYDPPNHVVNMSQAKQIPYDVALDLHADHAKAFGRVQLTPTTFLINPEGYITLQKIGEFDLDDMKQRIEKLLNKKG